MPEQEDYLTKWMNPTQQPQTTPKQTDYLSRWMGQAKPITPAGGTSRWQEEFWPSLGEVVKEIPAIKGWSKFITEQAPSKEFWERSGKNLATEIQQFMREKIIDEREASKIAVKLGEKMSPELQEWYGENVYRSVVGGEEPQAILQSIKKKPGLKEIGVGAGKSVVDLFTYLPEIIDKLVQNPGDTIENNPAGVLVLAFVAARGGYKSMKAKARSGKPIVGKDMHRVIDEMPGKLLSKKQKLEMKSKIPEQLELPLGNIEQLSPYQKIVNAIKEAGRTRKVQEELYTEARRKKFAKAEAVGKKVKGEKGYYAEIAQLKGELPKAGFESIRNKITQADVDSMFKQIVDSPALTWLETVPARKGLAKLFGEYGGVVPTEGELILLNRVFPKGFVQTIMSKRPTWMKIKAGMLEGANVPRALMASFDLSFGLRQGVFLAARYPKEFARSFIEQFKLFGSEKASKLLNEEIASRPTHKLMRRHGKKQLALTEMDAALSLREEAFMGAAWAEKIPLVGKGVRASNRAYTGFANKLRADVFDHLIKASEKTGRNPWKDPKLVDSIIDFVNAGSGRGSWKILEKSAVNLNTILFSPRLMASRLNLLNPAFYIKLDPFVRKQALQSLFAFAGAATTVLGLAKLAGADVETNMRSADFGKIKIGDTRIDIMGGFQQYIRTAAQFITGQIKSTTTGEITGVGEGYKPPTRLGLVGRGLEYKLAPVASFAVALLRGRGPFGGSVPSEAAKKFVPMVMQDIYELAKEDPELLPVSILGIFGTGIQTYGTRGPKVIY